MEWERSESGNIRGDVFTEEIWFEHSFQGWSNEEWYQRSTIENWSQRIRAAVSLDHVQLGTLLKHQFPITFLLGCRRGDHDGTGKSWGLLSHRSQKGSDPPALSFRGP